MKPVEVGLSEKIYSLWQFDGGFRQTLEQVRKPLLLWPEWSDQGQFEVPRSPDLVDDSSDGWEGGKGIGLEMVPLL